MPGFWDFSWEQNSVSVCLGALMSKPMDSYSPVEQEKGRLELFSVILIWRRNKAWFWQKKKSEII